MTFRRQTIWQRCYSCWENKLGESVSMTKQWCNYTRMIQNARNWVVSKLWRGWTVSRLSITITFCWMIYCFLFVAAINIKERIRVFIPEEENLIYCINRLTTFPRNCLKICFRKTQRLSLNRLYAVMNLHPSASNSKALMVR